MSTRRGGDGPAMEIATRYRNWCFAEKNTTQPGEKVAEDLERFAAELDALTPQDEPVPGWAAGLAQLMRRGACRARGEDPGPWPSDTNREDASTH